MKLTPKFDELKSPVAITEHINGLKKQEISGDTPDAVFSFLLKRVKPVDFETKHLPAIKVTDKAYAVYVIDEVLEMTKKCGWDFCSNQNRAYMYNGCYWVALDEDVLKKFLGEVAEKMGVPKHKARYFETRNILVEQFKSASYLPVPEKNKDQVLINLKNGTFEISPQGTRLRPFNPEDFLTYQLSFSYDPEARAPVFEEYLNRVLPDEQSQKVLAEYLGSVFLRNGNSIMKQEKVLVLLGSGENGKSTLFEIFTAMLGDHNVSHYSIAEITDPNGYARAAIADKLVNYCSEMSQNMNTEIFKKMASGEPITARLPYVKPFELKFYPKLIFNANQMPKDIEHTPAFFRRLLMIPFNVILPKEEQDENLHNKLMKELPGIFNWQLAGLRRRIEQGRFSECAVVDQELDDYKKSSNTVLAFLDEHGYKPSATSYAFVKEIYNEYRSFCVEIGHAPFGKPNFTKQLKYNGYKVERVSQNKMVVYVERIMNE